MDEIYEDLDNFNDENRIAELQAENKDLKIKLEDYASALAKLQKDFDTLSSEYKKLEVNYSSLLKTAKSEIERKTEIIKNLNIEKDEMVLKSLQKRQPFNRNNIRHTTQNDKSQNMKLEKNIMKPDIDNKILNQVKTDSFRVENKQKSAKEPSPHTPPVPQPDLRSRLLSIPKTSKNLDPRIQNSVTKENISNKTERENDSSKTRALIRNRRKSMPAVRPEIERFSSDDEIVAHARNVRDNLSRESSRDNRLRTHNNSETTNSRTSETPSLEDKHVGNNELKYRERQSRCDRESYRTRSKSSHRNKRYSPERPHRGPREYHNDYDRYKSTENQNHRYKNRSRESYRDDFDRKSSQERLHRNLEKHPTKHKIQHNFDEINNKRMKMDPHYRQFEEDQRLRHDRPYLENRPHLPHVYDDGIQFSSCESPDYNDADPHHQIREIKLYASTKLDDPRVSHSKYVVHKNDNQVVLSTTEGRNVNIIPVNKLAWGIEPVKMPDALMHKPPTIDAINKINVTAKTPFNSVESGEIHEAVNSKHVEETHNKTKIPKQVEAKIPTLKSAENRDTASSPQTIKAYKIPKQKKTDNGKQDGKNVKESILGKLLHETKPKKKRKLSASDETDTNENTFTNKHEKIHSNAPTKSNAELPFIGDCETYDRQDRDTANKVVEDDLQLSDDTCDNSEVQKHFPKANTVALTSDVNKQDEKNSNIHPENKNMDKIANEPKPIKLTIHLNKDKTVEDIKKKSKKKTKYKEAKEEIEKGSVEVAENPTKKKEKEPKKVEIKTKFCELFGDSSSLITPEDLGLPIVSESTTRMPDNCVPLFEDAQDAVDLKEKQTSKNSPLDKPFKEEHKKIDKKSESVNVSANLESVEKKNGLKPTCEESVELIYKNLEPGIPDKEVNVVKTVVISSGIQPQTSTEVEKQKIEPQIRVHEGILKALATSTPHKYELIQTESQLSENMQSINSDSQLSVDKSIPLLDNSEASTVDTQAKDNDAPDVRIFMKRRRRVIKK